MILHLGVMDVPYATAGGTTTSDVAVWLENRYHVMETFFRLHGTEVAADLEKSLSDALDSLLMGAPPGIAPFGAGTSQIEQRFRDFITNKEMDGATGVPTLASLEGVSKRFKRKRGPVRPSFVDTGLYENSFRAWLD